MDDLFKLLPGLLKSLPDSPEVRQAVVFAVWRKAAGDGLKEHTVPTELVKRRLFVAVRDKIWKRHLESMAAQLLFRLNALLESREIDFIEFGIDEDAVNEAVRSGSRDDGSRSDPEPYLVPDELIEKANLIKDDRLRKSFLESAAVYLKMKEVRDRK